MGRTRGITALLLAISLFACAGAAYGGVNVSTDLQVKHMFGYTKYRTYIEGDDPLSFVTAGAESELSFPMDVLAAATAASVSGEFSAGRPWSLTLRAEKDIADPGKAMTDSDWIVIPDFDMREQISSTESDAELSALVLDFSGRVQISRWKGFAVDGLLGYRYQTLSYEIYGVRGWQLDLRSGSGDRVYFEAFKGVNVLDYKVTHKAPYLGLSAGWASPPAASRRRAFGLRGEVAYSPAASAKDRDDHILRNKMGEGSCKGTFLIARLDVTWSRAFAGGRFAWSLGFGGELIAISTDGDQKQRFYGDDPGTDGDETGLVFTGIDDEIRSRQQAVQAHFGLRF